MGCGGGDVAIRRRDVAKAGAVSRDELGSEYVGIHGEGCALARLGEDKGEEALLPWECGC